MMSAQRRRRSNKVAAASVSIDKNNWCRKFSAQLVGKQSSKFGSSRRLRLITNDINANHPRERRSQSAGHETGHFIATRRTPEILHADETSNSREERYADAFGRALFTPPRALMQKFHDVTAGAAKLTRRHIIVLAHFFGVSREATVRRLEELGLTKPGTWDWFAGNGGISDEQVRQVLGDLVPADMQKAEADRPTTLRLNLLAAEVHRRGLLSEGQLARLLHLSRVELRSILEGVDIDDGAADGAISLE